MSGTQEHLRFLLGARYLIWTVLAVGLAAASCRGAGAVEPAREGQQNFLSKALFADGRVWLLSDAGVLSSVAENGATRVPSGLVGSVLDICISRGHVKALLCEGNGCGAWSIMSWAAEHWTVVTKSIATKGDEVVALSCVSDSDLILTNRRIVEIAGPSQSEVTLSPPLEAGPVTSTLATSQFIFLGINAGEWGGGLQRISRLDGSISSIERNATGQLCGGPLNASCDPVNGIVAEPWKPDCVAVAVGVVHFSPHGRIVEVCDREVKTIYSKAFERGDRSLQDTGESKDGEPFETVAFFGLAASGQELLAAGIDGLYRITADGTAKVIPLPKFKSIDSVGISFELQNPILVLTAINQRRSISGNVPLLVPR